MFLIITQLNIPIYFDSTRRNFPHLGIKTKLILGHILNGKYTNVTFGIQNSKDGETSVTVLFGNLQKPNLQVSQTKQTMSLKKCDEYLA